MDTTRVSESDTKAKVDFSETARHEVVLENGAIDPTLDSIEKTEIGAFIWLVTVTASVAGALFG